MSLLFADSGASLPDGVSPLDVAALIKCYLASIPELLTTFALYDELKDARVSIDDLKNILKKLPNVNYMTLEFVTALLLRVSRKSALNMVCLIPYFGTLSLHSFFSCFSFDASGLKKIGTKNSKVQLTAECKSINMFAGIQQ